MRLPLYHLTWFISRDVAGVCWCLLYLQLTLKKRQRTHSRWVAKHMIHFTQDNLEPLIELHACFGLWEETRIPEENPHTQEEDNSKEKWPRAQHKAASALTIALAHSLSVSFTELLILWEYHTAPGAVTQ